MIRVILPYEETVVAADADNKKSKDMSHGV